jgi:hypothetical protein
MERKEAVTVRRAEKRDAPLLAWAILQSTRGHQDRGFMDVRFSFLSEPEVLRLLQEMVEDDCLTCVRWDTFFVVEVDGQPAAGVVPSFFPPPIPPSLPVWGGGGNLQPCAAVDPRKGPLAPTMPCKSA